MADCDGPSAYLCRDYLTMLPGEEILSVWMEDFAACAAACHGVSERLRAAARNPGAKELRKEIYLAVDARSELWARRRLEADSGFTEQ